MQFTASGTPTEISLLDSLNQSWLKLPLAVMRDVGPATQTLGAIVRLTNKEMYSSAKTISETSRLPLATTRKHLDALAELDWIENAGRERTRAGRARRTCTIKVTSKTKGTLSDYSILPLWASCSVIRVGRLPWSTKAVLSLVMSRLAAMKAAIERQEGQVPNNDEFWGSLDNMGGEDHFRFSLERLERETGLHRESVVHAKRRLATLKIVDWYEGDDHGHLLIPNKAFRVVVTSASEGRCFVAFSGGSDSGQ